MRTSSAAGLSADRLGRLRRVLTGHVERGTVPGLVALVSRRDEVHVETIGTTAVAGDTPMRRDTIFRITSMTKPVTAVAAMILVEECVLRLDDPVDRWLPELADRRVLNRVDGPLDDTGPANRPITPRDLLTMRMGFGHPMVAPLSTPIMRAEDDAGLRTFGPPKPSTSHPPDAWMRELGALPLLRQPGEAWLYDTSYHVLGVLIARACGQPLESFLRERIFEPLGMPDTGFSVPADRLDRFAECYEAGADELTPHDTVADSQWSRLPAFPDAAGGLVSTVDDYLAFARMLLGNGRYRRGPRILSRPSVETMTANHLTPEQLAGAHAFLGDNRGWGFGVSMVTARDDISAGPGRYGWDGGYGTSWASDPREELIGIVLTQRLATAEPSPVHADFWTTAYAAIDD
ncbi:serine hydrolase domain-containing protein [Polymorphospora sp. NPDC050346]|uniref:serine hydrolase domain-containing protein n=1 Tax=Polymorphospora sp. NPDC050346 TaxID=3155780 RepID=UPI0033FC6C5A